MKISKKIIAIFILMIIFVSSIQNIVLGAATTLNSARIIKGNAIKTNVEFDGYEVEARYVYYIDENNIQYPAYCISHGVDGVEEQGDYSVDIQGKLDDDRVWRVITNGYPYKTLEGLTKEEAYFATKQAIYCVIVKGRTASQYTGLNERGKNIVQAIKNLEEIGENGTQTQENWNITVLTDKPLKEYGNYWYKEIAIEANTNIKEVKITNISNFPEGSFVSNAQGNPTTTFNSGKNARIMIPKSKLNQDINGIIEFTTELQTYPILYGKTKISGTQDYVITGDGYENSKYRMPIQEKLDKCTIDINKVDGETLKPIENVTFELLKNGKRIATAKTDKKGQATFSNLYQGDYQVREIGTLESYVLNQELMEVHVEYGGKSNKTIKNYYKTGKLQIYKTDSKTSEPIQGVTFELIDKNNKVIATGTTDEKGKLTFSNLKIGKYKLKEVKAPENYVLNTVIFDVEIEYNKTTIQNVQNEYKRGNLVINKIDKDNHKIALGGISFNLFSYELGKVIQTYTTDENGKLEVEGLRIGDYKLIEKATGKWYNLAEDVELKVNWNETTKLAIENELKKGQIKIIKVDKENQAIKIPGVTFHILNENDEILETIVTDENGEALTKKYPIRDYGNLKIQEVKTGKKYILEEGVQTIQLENDKLTELILSNTKKKGQIEITKISADDNPVTQEKKGSLLTGAIFEIYTEDNELIDSVTIGENGKGMSKLLECGNYNIKEKSTGSENYILNEETFHVTVKENGEVVPITIKNESIKIPEEPPKEEVEIPQEPPKEEVETPKEPQKPKVEVPKKLPKTGF